MAYTISYTDAANKGTIVLEDNTLNTSTSLQIPGRFNIQRAEEGLQEGASSPERLSACLADSVAVTQVADAAYCNSLLRIQMAPFRFNVLPRGTQYRRPRQSSSPF